MTELEADFCRYCEEHQRRLFWSVFRISRNAWDAEDATQEALLKLWRNWGDEEYRKRVWETSGHSVTCAINAWRDIARSAKSRAEREVKDARKTVVNGDAYLHVEGEDFFSWALDVLGSMNPTWRTVILLRCGPFEYTHAEVAAVLGISEASARRYERRAVKALQDKEVDMM